MNLCIIDLDGVIADSTERFKRAKRNDGSTDWAIAFTPELVMFDTLIDGTKQALNGFADAGDLVILLTSRPESMRDATEAWLAERDLRYRQLAMKTKIHQYVKTVKWKADEVQRLIKLTELSGLTVDHVIFIDDEPGNRATVEALGLENIEIRESLNTH